MATLAQSVARFEQVVQESSKAGAPESQAQQLELLHDIDQHLQLAPAETIKALQTGLEGSLTAALLQVRSAPSHALIPRPSPTRQSGVSP